MPATPGETWKQEWLAEGEIKGRAKGRIEAKIETLIFLAERRLGPLPSDLRQRVEAADPIAVEAWIGRLLDATSLETLFGSAS
jgi:hypothetical protein